MTTFDWVFFGNWLVISLVGAGGVLFLGVHISHIKKFGHQKRRP